MWWTLEESRCCKFGKRDMRKTRNHRSNIKAMPVRQLYGKFNGMAGEWMDAF